jgi:tripartite-type tricarboxylate transporter receptor subunit TctC
MREGRPGETPDRCDTMRRPFGRSKEPMRHHRLVLAALVLVLGGIAPAAAQSYPSRPITMVVPFPAGGGSDLIARIVAERMRKPLGQPVVIENVAGASGSIGVGRVVRAAPDGYTLVSGHWGTHVINGATLDLTYDLRTAFAPVVWLASGQQAIIAKKTMPADDLKGFIAWLKAHPDEVLMGTSGVGSVGHINGIHFQKVTGTRLRFVPYRGIAPTMQDLVAGQIDMMITSTTDVIPQVRAGTIKAYAISNDRRVAAAPEIPTVDEAGLPGFHTQMWHALWAPAGTPVDVIARLNAAAVEALGDPAVRKRLADIDQDMPPREQQTPEALGAHHKAEIEKWWPIIKAAGIKPE